MPPQIPLNCPPFSRRSALALITAFAADAALPKNLNAAEDPDWTTPIDPYRIAGNLHYVGSRDLASFLITTPQGHILINSNLSSSPAQIRASIRALGFHYHDIKILLISHAHNDHCAGSAQIKRETGARYMVMSEDIPVIESGGRTDFQYGRRASNWYRATRVDQALHDGQQVRLGDSVLTAHKTAGHTKGCTTWAIQLSEARQIRNAVIVGSPNVNPGYNLINDRRYPTMAADYAAGFRTLQSLPCDIFLGAHGSYYNMLSKVARQKGGDKNAFLDPTGYKGYIADRQKAFETELARQQHAQQRTASGRHPA